MKNLYFRWYIATAIIGSEESILNSLLAQIKSYDFDDYVKEMKVINSKEIKIEFFDNNNPPPKSMKNSKYIQWEALDDGRYKKITSKTINKFPGYIFINMAMTDQIWYIIRNTSGITGFVGSSGQGAKPIPISEFEIEDLFSQENEEFVTYINEKPEDRNPNNKKQDVNQNKDEFYDSRSLRNESVSDFEKTQPKNIVDEQENKIDDDFKVGHTVTILTGALVGENALIKNINDDNTVDVEIDMLGKTNIIKLNKTDIKKID